MLVAVAAVTALVTVAPPQDAGDIDRADVVSRPIGDGEQLGSRRPADLRADRSAREAGAEQRRWPVFARYENLVLRLPHPEPAGLRFTEGRRVGAVPLDPVGELTANANPDNFDPDRVRAAADGPSFAVSADAGRGRPATSSAVVTLPRGDRVGAPVWGEVVAVEQYPTVRGVDWGVILSPRTRPDLHVTVTGLHRPAVAVDDEIEPGQHLAVPRLTESGRPEVEVEAGPASAPLTLDVDEPVHGP